ncbi:MAG: hypothetical protein JWN95_3550 [Frankiales bacterium]|nr:hypothetical protein [Frankiales bacterium]
MTAAQLACPDDAPLPLAGLRVLDLTDGLGELGTRYLADLGADVIRVEPPGGGPSRRSEPLVDGTSLRYLTHNANKRAIELDLSSNAGQQTLYRLADGVDIIVLPARAAELASAGVTAQSLRRAKPSLVVVTISDFGDSGPYRDWIGTEPVLLAMAGVLSRSGLPGLPPLLPPGSLATESTALQCAWVALVAYFHRLRTGEGAHADVSAYEATAQVLDPGFGIGGSATSGDPSLAWPRGRPDASHLYPIVACADGWVRLCVLSARQWAGMYRWLGEPADFADPSFASLLNRHAASEALRLAYERHFANLTRDAAIAQGQQHGVPTAALLTLSEVAESEHFSDRRSFVELPLAAGSDRRVRIPNGLVEVDGRRAGIVRAAPEVGEHTAQVLAELATWRTAESTNEPAAQPAHSEAIRRPLSGLRVLDLGVIVVGAELGRLLADMGAEVIKVENAAFPDGSRQALKPGGMTAGFAFGHRNKTSIGLNLRDPRGKALFGQLAATADVVLSNFKPGTLESLGLGYRELVQRNPGIVMADSSAFGPTGPWSRRMGYGPLVRASCGLTDLWRYPDIAGSFSDASTIFPDHVAARVGAVAVLAKLIERRRTRRGGQVSVAQAETILTELGTEIALESVRPGSVTAVGNTITGDAPRGIFPCAGDDEWAVVTVRGDADFAALATAIGRPELVDDSRFATGIGRVANRTELDAALAAWTIRRAPRQLVGQLQAAGVPAGMMQRIPEFRGDPQFGHRRFLTELSHPLLAGMLPTERAPARFDRLPDPELRPAPLAGEQTREIAGRLLGLTPDEIESLLADGVLEVAVTDPIRGVSSSSDDQVAPRIAPGITRQRRTS